jgi:hypothetical protein
VEVQWWNARYLSYLLDNILHIQNLKNCFSLSREGKICSLCGTIWIFTYCEIFGSKLEGQAMAQSVSDRFLDLGPDLWWKKWQYEGCFSQQCGVPPVSIVPPMFHTSIHLKYYYFHKDSCEKTGNFQTKQCFVGYPVAQGRKVPARCGHSDTGIGHSPINWFPLLISFHQRFIIAFIFMLLLSQRQ